MSSSDPTGGRDGASSGSADNGSGSRDAAAPDSGSTMDAGLDGGVTPCAPFVMPPECLDDAGAVIAPPDGVLPADLRCTGLYADFDARLLSCEVLAYKPAYELWSDDAVKRRWVQLPRAEDGGAVLPVDASDPDALVFPIGTQFWKEFRIPDGEGGERLGETRLLRKVQGGWLFTSYVWSSDGTTAIQQNNGVQDLFGLGHVVPTRDECRDCHQGRRDFILGWDLIMLGEGATGLTRDSLVGMGVLTSGAGQVASLAVPGNAVERAALGYLHANCGISCHNPTVRASATQSGLLLRLEADQLGSVQDTDAFKTGINKVPDINRPAEPVDPPSGPFYAIRPGDVERSLTVARMSLRGTGQMPRVGTNVVDQAGVDAVSAWIEQMTVANGYPAPAEGGSSGGTSSGGSSGGGASGSGSSSSGGTSTGGGSSTGGASSGGGSGGTCASAPSVNRLYLQRIVSNGTSLSRLVAAAQPPGSSDWYLVRQTGRIMVLHNGTLQATPFLDLSVPPTSIAPSGPNDECGLLSMAFAPDYATSGRFYVMYTETSGGAPADFVYEYQRSTSDPLVADASTRRLIVQLPGSGQNHNGGTVMFGPDGYLYVSTGDGGGTCNGDQPGAPQNMSSLFGKILRLDPTAPSPHGVADNVTVAGQDNRVLHYGLRNPFRFGFDRVTGDLYVGDVGEERYEEINAAPAGTKGRNFGWADFEGPNTGACPTFTLRPGSTHTLPMLAADRQGSTFRDYQSIIGGIVYRGTELSGLSGVYFFGDYTGLRMGAFRPCGDERSAVTSIAKYCDLNDPSLACFVPRTGAPEFTILTQIVEGNDGEMYFVANFNTLYKVVATAN